MVLKADQQRVKALLTETVTLLCKNGLHFKSELCIEGLIGITLDQEEIFLVNIKETVKLNKPVSDNEYIKSPAAIESALPAKKIRQRAVCTEISSQAQTSIDSGSSSLKPVATTTPKEPLLASDLDNASTSVRRSCSPAGPSSVKSQSEDASAPPLSNIPSEANASERLISFYDVPIKLDFALGSQTLGEDAARPSEVHSNEPACKRLRVHLPSHAPDNQNKTAPSSTDEMPSQLSSCKQEPTDVIEIKEESMSDTEMAENSTAEYSSYADYGAMTAYGTSDLDESQMYGEASSFQSDAMFQDDMQRNLGSQAHEAVGPAQHLLNAKQRKTSVAAAPAPMATYVDCYECGKRFTGDYMVYSLRRHEATVHRGEFLHKCPVCSKGMQGIEDLRSHLVSKHKMPSDYRCDICNEDFGKKRTLHLHMLTKHSLMPCVKQ